MQLPKDPMILYSYINVMLRDRYPSFKDLCASYDVDPGEIADKLSASGFEYNEELNQFR